MRFGRVYKSTEESNIIYIYKNIKFYISSDYNKERMKKIKIYVEDEKQKIKNKYSQEMPEDFEKMLENYLAIYYYKNIEKRGYKYEIL